MAMIYLSSTYEDLKDYRRAVFEALRKAGHQVIAMEDYVAADQRPVEKCLKDVEEADIYVGLFAFRYGYIPPMQHQNADGVSISEMEYRHARGQGKPCLAFLATKGCGIHLDYVDACTGNGDRGERIKALREHLMTENLASQFSAPHELSTLVLAAVTKHLDEHKQPESVTNRKPGGPPAITWDIETQGSPYPGLFHFTRRYASVSFGRDREVREILDRLREAEGRFLLISGASGIGKSSLVDAGVLPRIEQDGIAGEGKYSCVRMVPSQGNHPFDALLRPLHSYAERARMDPYQLAEQLVREPGTLAQRIQNIVAKGLDSDGLVLFVDQMEELFTVRDPAQSQAFLSALYQAAQDASLHVIATIRSDFLPYCHEHADLLRVLNGRGYIGVGPIDGSNISEMISKSAHCAGLKISNRLARRLVEEAGQGRSLPLLAFVLQQLFENRERGSNELTEKSFDQLGGLAGAIRSHATTVEGKIVKSLGTEDREIFAKLFAPLVVVAIDRTPTRRWASKQKFDAQLKSVINILIKERLLTADEGKDHESLISVAHEILFEAWPRLAAWIETNREHLFILHQAEIEASEWKRHGYDLNYLWPEERLKKLQGILEGLGHEQVNPVVRLYAAPQGKLIERLQSNALSHTERLKIGQYLAAFGDPRPGVGVKDGVPDIAWIEIPGGQVKLEGVEHVFEVKPFRIAQYPVTNAQFETFRNAADGYGNDEWWRDIEQGRGGDDPKWLDANAPREMVSWCEAVAFCRWLSSKTRTNVRLPTEWEWQLAATGSDPTSEYPWEGGWDASRCNSDESRLDRTTAVGMYPNGVTTQAVYDMAGNVWEWCLNERENPEKPEAVGINNRNKNRRVVRGGSWNSIPGVPRVSNRDWSFDFYRNDTIGFRLAQDLEP